MPTFDLEGWPQVHAAVAGFRIRATMIYPTDEERRAELGATLAFTYYDTIRDDPNAWEREPTLTDLYPLFRVRHLGGSQAEVFQRAREVACRGSVAGEALIISIRWRSMDRMAASTKPVTFWLRLARLVGSLVVTR